ncbi:FAD-binding oxidoreductase [Brevirhabdus pacifica]|uniref:D-lactate dehydrogenase (cytochrome) n=1 Tax=Brevirhabdus pacifica TaxID=1267768 RepID=A0A1U7DMC1_9RHOB|nr:FAD-binding oxidoreductase [Brevirhabdus pacifica]
MATVSDILAQRFGPRFDTGKSQREQHAHTTTWLPSQAPDGVVFPQDVDEVREIVRICADHRVPIVPFGAGTSLEGHVNAPLGGISVDMRDMDRVLEVNAEDMDCRVQPGVTRKALNTHLRDTGLFFPIDPGADASLGGMASTRASGTNAVRYGTMKDVVLALQAVMPSGEVVRTARRARKTSAGYDLTRLMVGSEGTLGLITELTLRLTGIPEAMSSAVCSFPSVEAACDAVIATFQFGLPMARIELMDAMSVRAVNAYSGLSLPQTPLLLLEFHGSEAGVAEQAATFGEVARDHGSTAFEWTTDPAERTRLWQARHDAYWAIRALRPDSDALATDVCVPLSRLAEAVTRSQQECERIGLTGPVLGHVGDGNFHVTLMIAREDEAERAKAREYLSWLAELAISMEGTCTGEHGIGQGKRAYLEAELGAGAVNMMRAIKTAVDPLNIMNPGKIL